MGRSYCPVCISFLLGLCLHALFISNKVVKIEIKKSWCYLYSDLVASCVSAEQTEFLDSAQTREGMLQNLEKLKSESILMVKIQRLLRMTYKSHNLSRCVPNRPVASLSAICNVVSLLISCRLQLVNKLLNCRR